jgi:hypothetical protein
MATIEAPREMEGTVAATRRLAALLAVLVLVCVSPAVMHFNLATAPNWARVLILGGGLLLVYVAWLALMPCRETLRTITWVFAIAAAAGALTLALVLFSPRGEPLPLGIGEAQLFSIAWCAVISFVLSIGSVVAARLTPAPLEHKPRVQ